MVPSIRKPVLQEAHSVRDPSTQVRHSSLHPSHLLLTASWVYPGGQLATQLEFSKKEPLGHSVQWLLVVPEHLEQEGSQLSHVFVTTLLKSPGGQSAKQDVPFRKSPFGQEEHSLLLGPVQSAQSPWHESQVLVAAFGYLRPGQVVGHWEPSRYLEPVQLVQSELVPPEQVAH